MTPETLARAATALYGKQWQTALARDYGVADRTVRRWVARESPVAAGVAGDLVARLGEKAAEIALVLWEVAQERLADKEKA